MRRYDHEREMRKKEWLFYGAVVLAILFSMFITKHILGAGDNAAVAHFVFWSIALGIGAIIWITNKNREVEYLRNNPPKKEPAESLDKVSTEDQFCAICLAKNNLSTYQPSSGAKIFLCPKHDDIRLSIPPSTFDRLLRLMNEAASEYSPNGDIKKFTRLVMQIIKIPGFEDFWCNWINGERYTAIKKEIRSEDVNPH